MKQPEVDKKFIQAWVGVFVYNQHSLLGLNKMSPIYWYDYLFEEMLKSAGVKIKE